MDELTATYEYSDLEYIAAQEIGYDDSFQCATKQIEENEIDILEANIDTSENVNMSSDSSDSDGDEIMTSDDESEQDVNDADDVLQSAADWLCDDEADTGDSGLKAPRTKNEVEEQADTPEERFVDIKAEELVLAGVVATRIDGEHAILIRSEPTSTPLNEGSTLCLGDGKVFGKVHEVFGPITAPFYIVRWTESSALSDEAKDNQIEKQIDGEVTVVKDDIASVISGITLGMQVYSIRRLAQFIAPASLLRSKGSDASNLFDEEVAAEEQEFSDDEAELVARQARNQLRKGKRIEASSEVRLNPSSAAKLPITANTPRSQSRYNATGPIYPQNTSSFATSYPQYNSYLMQQQQHNMHYPQQPQQQQSFPSYQGWTPPPPPTPPPGRPSVPYQLASPSLPGNASLLPAPIPPQFSHPGYGIPVSSTNQMKPAQPILPWPGKLHK